jgi:threonine/homoserine/homoserine lactone efflux protein
MITFSLAIVLMLATPGPGVLSAAGVSAGFGAAAGLRYVAGLCIGQALVYTAVAAGLSAFVLDTPWLRITLMTVSFLYLLYLASRIAFAGAQVAFIRSENPPGLMAGLLLQPINPKAYAVLTALITGFPIYENAYWSEVAIKFVILNLIWVPIHVIWVLFGVSLKRLNLSPKAQRAINISMALSMLLVVGLAAWTLL